MLATVNKTILLVIALVLFAAPVRSNQPEDPSRPQTSKFAKALAGLNPQNDDDSGLLLAFDTDTGDDSEGYAQFYDYRSKDPQTKPSYATIYLTRKGARVDLTARLDYVASPQRNGFLYLGRVRYFEPKPRVPNKDLEYLTKDEDFKIQLFGFDYTRIWLAASRSQIEQAKNKRLRETKAGIDAEFRKSKEKEWMQNITDYEKIGFISSDFYVADGYWSQITGGAAMFQATTKNRIVPLSNRKISGRLHDWYSQREILENFRKAFDDDYRSSEDAKYNDMDAFWGKWKARLDGRNKDALPTFTFERQQGKTNLVGLVLVDGNAHRSFHASADFGPAPKSLIAYDNPPINFAEFLKAEPDTLDVFVSPNRNTVFVLTKTRIIGLDVKTKVEIFNISHNLEFNKVIMAEWATKGYVDKWKTELSGS